MKKFHLSTKQICVLGTCAGLMSVFGVPVFQIGGFILFFKECGSTADSITKIGGACMVGIYLLSLVLFLYSLGALYWRRRSGQKDALVALVPVLLMLAAGVYRCGGRYLESRAYDAVFYGDVELYQKISTKYDQAHLADDLWLAARWGHLELVKYLLSRGANPNASFGGGGNSILQAAHENLGGRPEHNKAVIDCLIQAGAKETPTDEERH